MRDANPITPPCLIVVFGARGDLTRRLVLPALYNLRRSGALPEQFAVIGVDHGQVGEAGWRRMLGDALRALMAERDVEFKADAAHEQAWSWLRSRLYYLRGDFADAGTYRALGELLETIGAQQRSGGNVLFYLATAARFFAPVIEHLGAAGLVRQVAGEGWRRVIVEKPFGHDLRSAQELNAIVGRVLDEDQVFRIDHFLGKETVQNILAFRFANGLFEPVWNRDRIDHVQITAAETIGVEGRGGFYDPTGCLRDMVPNHLFQLLAMIAMEPPAAFTPAAMLRRRAEVIEAVRPLTPVDVVRGQYAAGAIGRNAVPGYREEDTVSPDSNTETYVAMKLQVDTWRWAGVPFYLRTGKRLRERTTEIAIRFKPAPLAPLRSAEIGGYGPDWLVLHIQPDEGISLQFDVKRPGARISLAPVRMDFRYRDWFPKEYTVGYERLLQDCMHGEAGLFQDATMVEAAWRIVQPILDTWQTSADEVAQYPAGSAGPATADALLALNGGHSWRALTAGRRSPAAAAAPARPSRQRDVLADVDAAGCASRVCVRRGPQAGQAGAGVRRAGRESGQARAGQGRKTSLKQTVQALRVERLRASAQQASVFSANATRRRSRPVVSNAHSVGASESCAFFVGRRVAAVGAEALGSRRLRLPSHARRRCCARIRCVLAA